MSCPGDCALDQAGSWSCRSLGPRGPQDPGAGQAARGTGAIGMKDAQRGCGATCGREGPGQVSSPSAAPPESRPASPGGRPGAWEDRRRTHRAALPASSSPLPAPQRAAAAMDAAPGRAPRGHAPFTARGWIGERCGQWRANRREQRRRCGGGALRRRRCILRPPPPPPRWGTSGPGYPLCLQKPWITTCSLPFTWVLRPLVTQGCLPTCMSSDTVQG